MINPHLMRLLQGQTPGWMRDTRSLPPEVMQRRNFELPMESQPASPGNPISSYSPRGVPTEHVADFRDFRDQQAYERAIAEQSAQPQPNFPASQPQSGGSWLDRLQNDPQRMGLLRFGLGAISGQPLGQAMDSALNVSSGNYARQPGGEFLQIPFGNQIVSVRNHGNNRVFPGWPEGMSPVPGLEPMGVGVQWRGRGRGSALTTQQKNYAQAKDDPEFAEFLKKNNMANTPASIQKWNVYKSLNQTEKEQFNAMQRQQKYYDVGSKFVKPGLTGTDPQQWRSMKKDLAPEKKQGYLRSAEEAKVGGKGKATRLQEDIDVGVRNADATIIVRRNLDILETLKTGGFEAAKIKFKAMFGMESANEAELMRNMGIAVLQQIRPIFGAQPSEREGRLLVQLEQGIGKSTVGNERLLRQALKQLQRLADIGMKGAISSKDYRTAARIQEALKFDLSEGIEPEAETAPAQKGLSEMSDEEFKRKYDSRRRR